MWWLMVGYMNLEERVDADFVRARRRSSYRRLRTRLLNGRALDRLPCFDDARRRLGARGGVYRGLRVVRSTDVVGSVGRCSEFDRSFLPVRASTEPRWKRVDRAFHRIVELPPVSLYKIGDAYFALDGNHRVSVARFHGVEWIDAEVTEFGASLRAAPRRLDIPEEPKMQTGVRDDGLPVLEATPRRDDLRSGDLA